MTDRLLSWRPLTCYSLSMNQWPYIYLLVATATISLATTKCMVPLSLVRDAQNTRQIFNNHFANWDRSNHNLALRPSVMFNLATCIVFIIFFLCPEYAQLFAALIARTAKDVDVLIDSLPSEESTAALQVSTYTSIFQWHYYPHFSQWQS